MGGKVPRQESFGETWSGTPNFRDIAREIGYSWEDRRMLSSGSTPRASHRFICTVAGSFSNMSRVVLSTRLTGAGGVFGRERT